MTAALDQSVEAIAIFTADESPIAAQIVYVNEAHERLSGYSADQLVGHSSVLLAGARPDLAHVREVTTSAQDAPFFAVTRKHRPDGSVYQVEMHVAPLRDRDGEVRHFVLTQRDVSRRAYEIDEATRLLKAESLAIGRFAAGAAFELEAPLSRVLVDLRAVLAAGLADDDAQADAQASALRRALESAEQLESTVRGLRSFTALEDASHGVDVHEAIELAIHFAQGEIGARAVLKRSYSPVRRARGSTKRLAQVLMSLLRNAADAIPDVMPHANSISVQTGTTAGFVTIDVVDTGVGIEREDLAFVFDPFFTSKPHSSSVGLGLASARAAIHDMGGALTVESTPGRGTRFRIALPEAEESVCPVLPFFQAEGDVAPTRRVLCVAANAADARSLGDVVDEGEAQVIFATCDEALERLACGESYDLVLCEARAAARAEMRERLRRLAPAVQVHTLVLPVLASPSGTYPRTIVGRRSASGARGH